MLYSPVLPTSRTVRMTKVSPDAAPPDPCRASTSAAPVFQTGASAGERARATDARKLDLR